MKVRIIRELILKVNALSFFILISAAASSRRLSDLRFYAPRHSSVARASFLLLLFSPEQLPIPILLHTLPLPVLILSIQILSCQQYLLIVSVFKRIIDFRWRDASTIDFHGKYSFPKILTTSLVFTIYLKIIFIFHFLIFSLSCIFLFSGISTIKFIDRHFNIRNSNTLGGITLYLASYMLQPRTLVNWIKSLVPYSSNFLSIHKSRKWSK